MACTSSRIGLRQLGSPSATLAAACAGRCYLDWGRLEPLQRGCPPIQDLGLEAAEAYLLEVLLQVDLRRAANVVLQPHLLSQQNLIPVFEIPAQTSLPVDREAVRAALALDIPIQQA
jgi:hypothetical protein